MKSELLKEVMRDRAAIQRNWQRRWGWSVPTSAVLKHVLKFVGDETVLETGAGKGLWSAICQESGIKLIATDQSPQSNAFTVVEEIGAVTAIQKYNPAILMLVCPHGYEEWAIKAFKGNKLVYIGPAEYSNMVSMVFFRQVWDAWDIVARLDTVELFDKQICLLCERKVSDGDKASGA